MQGANLLVRAALTAAIFTGAVAATAQQSAPVPPPPVPANTPAPVPATTPAPAPAASPAPAATYTIQAGDNPWTIAQKHGVSLPELLKINDIKDPKNLMVGDVLKLPVATAAPAVKATVPVAPAKVETAAPAGEDWEYYTIAKGDNPWKIAKARGIPHQKIISLNEGTDFTKLAIGQKIKVPKKK